MAKTKPFDFYSDEYEEWFNKHSYAFKSELNAIKTFIPMRETGIEIGIGSGIFAQELGIKEGIEPSEAMRQKAAQKNMRVINAVAENLPYPAKSKNFALMVTTVCFVDDIYLAFKEAYRVLKNNGSLIIGFVDKNSMIGKKYVETQKKSIFYKEAIFYSAEELMNVLKEADFYIEDTCQTLFGKLDEINEIQTPLPGYGKGSFVVIKATKFLT